MVVPLSGSSQLLYQRLMDTIIWHNPRCSKSRQTLALLREHDVEPTIRRYLDDAPSVEEIRRVIELLALDSARELMRRGEAVYKELSLKSVEDEQALIAAMAEEPRLIERPVVIRGEQAALGRPPEDVLAIL